MKNLVILSEATVSIDAHILGHGTGAVTVTPQTDLSPISTSASVVDVACDFSKSEILYLLNIGVLVSYAVVLSDGYSDRDPGRSWSRRWNLADGIAGSGSEPDDSWFYVSAVAETGSIVCVSRRGNIVSIKDDLSLTSTDTTTGRSYGTVIEHEGEIENGILAASWNTDQSILLLVTGNNTIMAMTNSWDVLQEVSIDACMVGAPFTISWSGDGEYFTTMYTDAASTSVVVKVYNKDIELSGTGRYVAEGAAGVMKNLGPQGLAFATNGTLVAAYQQRVANMHQISFMEKNGLFHGNFDLKCPQLPPGCKPWSVAKLHWDLPSALLAVTLIAASDRGSSSVGVVQLYSRSNYNWALKQEWSGHELVCLGFDSEILGRLYLTERSSFGDLLLVRVVDLVWDVCTSATSECSVCVVSGSELRLTAFRHTTIPPPMCGNTLSLPAACRMTAFWKWSQNQEAKQEVEQKHLMWGLGCLCGDSLVALFAGDDMGRPVASGFIDFVQHFRQPVFKTSYRGILVSQSDFLTLKIVLVRHNCLPSGDGEASASSGSVLSRDELVILTYAFEIVNHGITPAGLTGTIKGSITSIEIRAGFEGSISRIAPWPADANCCAVGLADASGNMDVMVVQLSGDTEVGYRETEGIGKIMQSFSLPEVCSHIEVIAAPSNAGDSDTEQTRPNAVVIGLSSKNRLYCGETLLMSGASSFAVNTELQMLMFITVGTRPHLHFASFGGLFAIDPLQGEEDRVAYEYAEPRPVERGARFVASVPGGAKVVIQLPRGNLEAFEPRPLILMQARRLMDQGAYLESLVMLRRQRIDLNLLLDHDPAHFFAALPGFVEQALSANAADLLSLFISSLDSCDITLTKYIDPERPGYCLWTAPQALPSSTKVFTVKLEEKVDYAAKAIRAVLLDALRLRKQVSALNPILCTCAKETTPSLVEALAIIRELSATTDGSSGPMLTPAKAQAAIKYLAFLADNTQIFEAALGECDFDMARAIARQCQMDPKAYMPLLESFEAIGKATGQGSYGDTADTYMRYRVNVHLARFDKALDWAIEVFRTVLQSSAASGGVDVVALCDEVYSICKKSDLFETVIPRLRHANFAALSSDVSTTGLQSIKLLVNKIRNSFGEQCVTKLRYSEAVAVFLSMEPPNAVEAIRAARLEGRWRMALSIACRFSAQLPVDVSPQRVASEIVSNYKDSLERGDVEFYGQQSNEFTQSISSVEAHVEDENQQLLQALGNGGDSQSPLEAARIAVEYCKDPEIAIAILVLSGKWIDAINYAILYQRTDLLDEDVAPAVRSKAKEMLKTIPARGIRQSEVVVELSKLWANPDERIAQVSTTDQLLAAELTPSGAHDNEDDARSEFSAASNASYASNVSRLSRVSSKSGTSTVSILSNLSTSSSASSSSSAMAKKKSFSIEGIEHSLLSRGKVAGSATEESGGGNSFGRKQKRAEKRRAKGEGKDVWGLRKECMLCNELWLLGDVKALAVDVKAVCEALLLLGGFHQGADFDLACSLQATMDAYTVTVQSHPAPIAPKYPSDWLVRRLMITVLRFQEDPQPPRLKPYIQSSPVADDPAGNLNDANPSKTPKHIVSWWEKAATGIQTWRTFKRVALY